MTVFDITSDTYFDEIVGLTGGSDIINIKNGATLTIRTDTRVHENAPSGNIGMRGNINVIDGILSYDATNVRWMAFDNASGVVPAIGTIITQNDVSGYLLGVWQDVASAQTAVGSDIPASGFMKFMWVTGGSFSVGGLTGISASCSSPDVLGWIEVSSLLKSSTTVLADSTHKTRGGRFYLDNTTGEPGQNFTVPCMGSTALQPLGMWVEKEPNSLNRDEDYTWWGAISFTTFTSTVYYQFQVDVPDDRQCFLKTATGGVMTNGFLRDYQQPFSYAMTSSYTTTYTSASSYMSDQDYIWEDDTLTVYCNTGHFLKAGYKVGLNFSTGDAVGMSGTYEVSIINSSTSFSIELPGSGLQGKVGVGAIVYCTSADGYISQGQRSYYSVLTGDMESGWYLRTGNQNYNNVTTINCPHQSPLSGTASCGHIALTFDSVHNISYPDVIVDLLFIDGSGISGKYKIMSVYSTKILITDMDDTSLTDGVMVTGSGILTTNGGYVPSAGLRTWVPNILISDSTSTSSNTAQGFVQNMYTSSYRTYWDAYGTIDFEYLYMMGSLLSFNGSRKVSISNTSYADFMSISNNKSPFNVHTNSISSLTSTGYINAANIVSVCNPYGGTISGCCARNYTSYGADFFDIANSNDIEIVDCDLECGMPSNNKTMYIKYANNIKIKNNKLFPGYLTISNSDNIVVENIDTTYCAVTDGKPYTSPTAVINLSYVNNFMLDGVTAGWNWKYPKQYSGANFVIASNCSGIYVRNVGSVDNPMVAGKQYPETANVVTIFNSSGNNDTVSIQKAYFKGAFRYPFLLTPSDRNIKVETVYSDNILGYGSMYTARTNTFVCNRGSNITMRSYDSCYSPISNQPNTFDGLFIDTFDSDNSGYLQLIMNVPVKQVDDVHVNSGDSFFDGAGAYHMNSVGCSTSFTDDIYRLGYTGFAVSEAILASGIISNYNIVYEIDKNDGNGMGQQHSLYNSVQAISSVGRDIELGDASSVEIGDYVWGNNVQFMSSVVDIDGNVVTIDRDTLGTVSGYIRFNHIPNEVVSSTDGFKTRITVTTTVDNNEQISNILIPLKTDVVSKYTNYPLDTYTYDIDIPNGYTYEVVNIDSSYMPDSGSTVVHTTTSGVVEHNLIVGNIIPYSTMMIKTDDDYELYKGVVSNNEVELLLPYEGKVYIEIRKADAAPFYKQWDITADICYTSTCHLLANQAVN